jgi:peptidoglycan/LPS O-acetylase OafA/YrhL
MASLYSDLLYFSCLISWEHYIQPLSILGDYSFGIYFVHVAWIAVSTKLVHLIPEANMLPVYQFFQLVFVLFFSLASIFFERKILGPKLAEQVLGF